MFLVITISLISEVLGPWPRGQECRFPLYIFSYVTVMVPLGIHYVSSALKFRRMSLDIISSIYGRYNKIHCLKKELQAFKDIWEIRREAKALIKYSTKITKVEIN